MANKLKRSVKAASAEVEGSEESLEEQKEVEGETSDVKERKKKRVGFHDKKVGETGFV